MKPISKFNRIFSIYSSFPYGVIAMLYLLFFCISSMPASSKPLDSVIVEGYLIDLLCAQERTKESDFGQKHTLKCLKMPVCDRSGFGILLDDNQLFRFEQSGNQKVRRLIQNASKISKIRIRVSGTLSGDALILNKIDFIE